MINCVKLYNIIRKADELTDFKSWVYLLYYPLMKELDSMNRYLVHGLSGSYNMDLSDGFYFGFGLFDPMLPAISIDEFRRILNNTSTFIPSPLKNNVPLIKDFGISNAITNYHDASPCFILRNGAFRVIMDNPTDVVDENERKQIINLIMEEIIEQALIDIRFVSIFKVILTKYVQLAVNKFKSMFNWLERVANSNISMVVTDQTLAPAQCCVNHYLKAHGKHIVTFQHQKNMLLTDIFPLVFLDLSLSDVYHTWFSYDFLEADYVEYLPYVKTKIVQMGTIKMPLVDNMSVLNDIENSTTCLLILNAVEDKFVKGTMNLPYNYHENILKIIKQLNAFHYKVYIRRDPRSNGVVDNVEQDSSDTLRTAIQKYDICICDRPGGAAIEVLEEKGFVFICFDQSEFRKTPSYIRLQEKGNQLRKIRLDLDILNCEFDLLIA